MENDKQLSKVVSEFREETEKHFKPIDGMSVSDIEELVTSISSKLFVEAGYDVRIMNVAISGSRCRGIENDSSDLDVVLEYVGTEREDDVFNLLHEKLLTIGNVEVDINPIRECESGTLREYLKRAESYLEKKSREMNMIGECQEKQTQKQEDKSFKKTSLKERLAEKKALIGNRAKRTDERKQKEERVV